MPDVHDTAGPRRTPGEVRRTRRYAVEFSACITVAVVLILLPIEALVGASSETLRTVWALLPLFPALGATVAVIRYVRRIDELQRRLVTDALAIAFGASMLTALAVAFVRSADQPVGQPEWAVFLVGMLAFGLAVAILSARASR